MAKPPLLTPEQILARTSAFFGQKVLKLTAPGGSSRASFRAYFADRTVIVSQRPDDARARVEALVLATLSPLTNRLPRLLGQSDGLVFQEDAGLDRLNWTIHTLPPHDRPRLAGQAIDAIFDLHRAARQTDLAAALPATGLRRITGDDLLDGARRFARQMRLDPAAFDPARLGPWFRIPGTAFTKWDCRAGNAALDPQGHLRWFDFEDSRRGHGPEDFAWLMADETWPLPMDQMFVLIAQRLTPEDTPDRDAWLTHLREYAALQAIRRLRLIFSEAKRKGWVDKITILKYDRVGTNPHMGEGLAISAARLARQGTSTAPLAPMFDQAAEAFRRVRIAPSPGGASD